MIIPSGVFVLIYLRVPPVHRMVLDGPYVHNILSIASVQKVTLMQTGSNL